MAHLLKSPKPQQREIYKHSPKDELNALGAEALRYKVIPPTADTNSQRGLPRCEGRVA
ncbi:Unannotated [Lentimonas sp. CC4]|nr:Unannotated [Lentimonas sp. CC4]CAA6686103.1 Unannotated [Lentimonas sp. CC6]CAA7074135.1 Unannotated [Lentimonas sp. CC4]CAA7171493.1 Unannotated [Lentimonas sp. CC21]CAA7181971.1 Unannotated [Lentimonas sp. CC8]